MSIDWKTYKVNGLYDELMLSGGRSRRHGKNLVRQLDKMSEEELAARQAAAERAIKEMGVTFTVYSEEEGTIDRAWPFDIIPRIIAKQEWDGIEAGLKQRVRALNLFIDDLYHEQKIVKDGVFPAEVLAESENFRPQCIGVDPPLGIWAHICGSDLVRDTDGTMYVLEDNLRVPSGVSYMLENRLITKRVFPELFESYAPLPVDDYPTQLYEMLAALSPRNVRRPSVAVLTPGIYNSAYFEHSFLSQPMGVELVEGQDLVVSDGFVHMLTTKGLKRVDVLYRRIDDDFIDPAVFRPDSMLGVRGLIEVYKAGRIAMANAPGTGIADDKVIYAYVPKIIKYYTGEEAILPNVPTYICREDQDRAYVMAHLDQLVVKAANESGGYGMLVGPHATETERAAFAEKIAAEPRNYMAQPTISLSRVPTIVGDRIEGRHVDLRPYVLFGEEIYVQPGGLTRVALTKGSLVVNSSQGGGSKDTWVL